MNRRLILALAAASALTGCGEAQKQPERKEVVFSILSAESQTSAEADWAPFLADMSKALGRPVVELPLLAGGVDRPGLYQLAGAVLDAQTRIGARTSG